MKDPMLMRCWDNVVAFIDAGGCFLSCIEVTSLKYVVRVSELF